MKDVPWTAASTPWNAEGLGNHRAVIRVNQAADICTVGVPWRRRDVAPQKMGVRLLEAATGREITNLVPLKISREVGQYAFEAARPGEYHLYYMPCKMPFPHNTEYLVADYSRADPGWVHRHGLETAPAQLPAAPEAEVVQIESRTEFDSFYPMEVVATEEEISRLLSANRERPYLAFPEDRGFPVRMTEYLPHRWMQNGPSTSFAGEAQPNEFYAFQIALYAVKPIELAKVQAGELKSEEGKVIPAAAITCFNLEGKDWLGRTFTKRIQIQPGRVQALWLGVDVPDDACGTYRGMVTVAPENATPLEVSIAITVAGPALKDRGDSELWRHSRIRWLNSTIGLDDEPTAEFPPLKVQGHTIDCLGRRIRLGDNGLPEAIQSFFAPAGDRVEKEPVDILQQPVEFIAEMDGKRLDWQDQDLKIEQPAAGLVQAQVDRETAPLSLHCRADIEFDGHIEYYLTLKAKQDVSLSDARLKIRLRQEIATYMIGFGCKGGYRPKEWKYRWSVDFSNNMVWLGQPNAGLQCKLKHVEDVWALLNLRDAYGLPQEWANEGKGGCDISEEGEESILLDAFTGPRCLKSGQSILMRFALLITPTKPVDTDAHWSQRYYHAGTPATVDQSIPEAVESRARVLNLHHGNHLLPHINYPFLYVDKLKRYVNEAHDKGLKIKFYYTIRELSNFVTEFWMLRSLGEEIYQPGKAGLALADRSEKDKADPTKITGHSWLCEHLVQGYEPAWHQPLDNGMTDAALIQKGLSRWHNYYLEGLRWLVEEIGIDGLYLDGIGYDRQIMKRVRKVLDRRPGCLMDFHGSNMLGFWTGMNNAASQNMEHFPFVDSLWFGEFFNYDESPEYWLVEMSGIPYGLMNEMLQDGGNRWRGMLFGMTTRIGWPGDPRPMWKFWDDFGMKGARMIGFWVADCPAKTDHADVRATVYTKESKTLVSLASWANEDVTCHLKVDWQALGLNPEEVTITAPTIEGFQEGQTFGHDQAIAVPKGKGWLLVLEQ